MFLVCGVLFLVFAFLSVMREEWDTAGFCLFIMVFFFICQWSVV